MEHPYATWKDYLAHITQKDVLFKVNSNFWNCEEQSKTELATLRKEFKNLQTELQEHGINAIEGTPKAADPNQKRRQNATRSRSFC